MLTYTILGSIIVVGFGILLGLIARKKKKYTTIKPTGTASKLYKTVEGVHPTFNKNYSKYKDKFVPIPVEPPPSLRPPWNTHYVEGYKEYKCPVCEHEKGKPLSAVDEIKKEEDARVFKEINKAINKGIHIQSSYGHRIDMTDVPEYPKCTTDEKGNKTWKNKEGQTHREDGPAFEYDDGTKCWYLNGQWHREDGPAIIFADGRKNWCLNGIIYTEEEWKKELNKPTCTTDPCGNKIWRNKKGEFHREDGPAVVYPNGNESWFLNNTYYTEEDWKKELVLRQKPSEYPKCTRKDTFKFWKNEKGEFHREDGPAFEYDDGTKCWYINGEFHREDGPSIEYPNESKHWHLNGVRYSEEEWKKELVSRRWQKVTPENEDYWIPLRTNPVDYSGVKKWFDVNGRLHREDGPAVVFSDGTKQWYINGQRHREDGPAIEWYNGYKEWYLNGKQYSEKNWVWELSAKPTTDDKLNKPKTDKNGNKKWTNKDGRWHREDGPAVIYTNGTKAWWLNGKQHREDGPAVEFANGKKHWWLNGKRYPTETQWKQELDKPKCETDKDGNKLWRNKEGQIHREDGPAIELLSGYKEWIINGERHREDGPAVEYPDGSKRWYLHNQEYYTQKEWKQELDKPKCTTDSYGNKFWHNKEGQNHREDGPAREHADGTKSWWINGQRHREDGPALERSNGTKEWYLNGKYYTEKEWKKELDKPKCETDENGAKKWTNKEGDYHREDGPAIEWKNGDKQWFINGKRHREDGPACTYASGQKYWYLNGNSYTEEEWKKELDKPKCETGPITGHKIWYNKEGQRHREDGPAFIGSPDNGDKAWFINGQLHREDGPAIERKNGDKEYWLNARKLTEEEWKKELDKPTCIDSAGSKCWKNKEGKYHREDGPAIEWKDGSTFWYINGLSHREDGPACTYMSDEKKKWYLNGISYTEENWKKELDKPKCTTETTKHYRDKKGQYHREDGPAFEDVYGTKHWCIHGYFHREDGPAIEQGNGTKRWYLNGVEYSEEMWKEYTEKSKCTILSNGDKSWHNKQDQLHREDGPAYEWANGNKFWFLNNILLTEEDWKMELDKISLDRLARS